MINHFHPLKESIASFLRNFRMIPQDLRNSDSREGLVLCGVFHANGHTRGLCRPSPVYNDTSDGVKQTSTLIVSSLTVCLTLPYRMAYLIVLLFCYSVAQMKPETTLGRANARI